MKPKLIFWFILLLAVFLLGFVPQYSRAKRLEGELSTARSQIASEHLKAELCLLRHAAAMMYFEVTRKNYGTAADYSSRFFDTLNAVSNQTADANLKKNLNDLLALRGPIDTGLAQGDPAVLANVQELVTRANEVARG